LHCKKSREKQKGADDDDDDDDGKKLEKRIGNKQTHEGRKEVLQHNIHAGIQIANALSPLSLFPAFSLSTIEQAT